MKSMTIVLTYFAGAATASAWFCAALWGRDQLEGLWSIPIFLTIIVFLVALKVSLDEND